MAKVLLGDVVDHVKDKVDKDATDLEYYVGGEHIDGDEIMVHRKGMIQGSTIGPAFHMRFQRGDVLLMSRNPHLRKASMVDFDGICSDVSYICRTKDNDVLLQSLLPFILQTPEFWQFAEENKKGGLPFFLNWKDFARFEFELQPIERQRQIADLLWAMERVKIAYRELIARTDDLVKSQFIEMFGDPVENEKGWPIYRFSEVAASRLGKMLDKRKQTGLWQRKYLANANVQWFSFDLQNLNQMDFDEADQKEFELHDGDLLVCEGGEIGRCAIWRGELSDCYFQKAIHRVRCNTEMLLPEYLGHSFYYHSQKNGFSDVVSSKSTIAHLPGDKLKAMRIIVPPMEIQKRFVAFLEQSDKSKFAAQQALKEVTDAQKALMKKIFE